MQLPSAKDLRALLKVCREYGVEEVSVGELRVKFGEMPSDKAHAAEDAADAVVVGPSAEEIAYWSAQPDPLAAIQEASA